MEYVSGPMVEANPDLITRYDIAASITGQTYMFGKMDEGWEGTHVLRMKCING